MKADSHPSFNFADLFLTLSKCPKHCAHTKRGDTEVSGPLYVFLLYFPDCTTSILSPSASPHCTGGVRRSRDTFAYLLSLCARVGWHGLPQSITHPARSAASSPWPAAPWEGKIFQFQQSGTELGIASFSRWWALFCSSDFTASCRKQSVSGCLSPMVGSGPKGLP